MTKSILLADGVTTAVVSSFVENFSPPSSNQKLPEENKKTQEKPKRRPCVVGIKRRARAQWRSTSRGSPTRGSPTSPNISDSFRPSYRFMLIEANAQEDVYQRLLEGCHGDSLVRRSNDTPTVEQSQLDGASSTIATIDQAKELDGAVLASNDREKGFETLSLYRPYKQRVWQSNSALAMISSSFSFSLRDEMGSTAGTNIQKKP